MKKFILTLFVGATCCFSCDTLMQVANTAVQQTAPLTSTDVGNGLKQALALGVDTAVNYLHATDGYYLDELVKINFPDETLEVLEYAKKVPGIDKMLEDALLSINRSAEDAAISSVPIFKKAITSLTIEDAWGILRGGEHAATDYLTDKTSLDLTAAYLPIVNKSLDKPLVAGVSANQSWKEVTDKWNMFAKSLPGQMLGVKSLDFSLGEYVTQEAIKGMFTKVAIQETKIRTNTEDRVGDLVSRVFSELD